MLAHGSDTLDSPDDVQDDETAKQEDPILVKESSTLNRTNFDAQVLQVAYFDSNGMICSLIVRTFAHTCSYGMIGGHFYGNRRDH